MPISMDPFQSLLKPGRSVIFYLMFPTHWPHASTQPYSPWRHFEIGFYQPTIRIYMLNSIQCWWTRCSYSIPPKLCFDSNKGTVPLHHMQQSRALLTLTQQSPTPWTTPRPLLRRFLAILAEIWNTIVS